MLVWLLFLALVATACGQEDRAGEPGSASADSAAPREIGVTIHLTGPNGLVPVRRTVRVPADASVPPVPVDSLRAALAALVQGLEPADTARGLTSFWSEATSGAVRRVEIIDGRAVVDFRDLRPDLPNATSSAGSRELLDQLNATVFQVGSVRSAKYRMRGSCDAFWNWLQRPCRIVVRGDRRLSQDQGGARRGRSEATISHGPARWLLCFPRWAGRVPAEEALASICRSRGRDEDGA